MSFDSKNISPNSDDNRATDIDKNLDNTENNDGQGFNPSPDDEHESLDDKEDLLDEVLEDEAVLTSDDQQEEEAWSLPLKAVRRSSNFVHKPFVDGNGWTRVGTQPIKVYPFVQTAPASTAEAIIRASVRGNLVEADSRLPGNDSVAQRISDIQLSTFKRFIPHSQDRVEMVCDYTGSKSSWSPSPLRISMEAILPYVVVNGEILYHHPTNVCNTMVSLNLMKRGQPILVLSLLGEFLRTHQEPDFRRRKAAWTWTYTALANVATMNKIFHCVLDHAAQIERWVKWSPDKQKAVLGHLRTGKPGPAVWEELATWDQYDLLGDSNNQFRKNDPDAQKVHWAGVYQSLLKIGLKYGLTHEEFETYCTISTSSGRRVFYPYHILSRPQGKRMWSWNALYSTAKIMLTRMQTACNKHAQAAGLGEDGMDPLRFIYWWAHHLCGKVQGIKCERPTASREEVAFHILDRWGLPVVPWTANILKASLCKLQDHGIAMMFGLCLPDKDTSFDPVEHFDLARCTVTIDTVGTNMAMLNYPTGIWDSIREMISMVPLSHPFWEVDQALGGHPWSGNWKPEVVPLPPTLPFNIPLVPIERWLDGSTTMDDFRCDACATKFNSAGLVVRHHYQHHAANSNPPPLDVTHPAQDQIEVDNKFWALRDRERTARRSAQNPCPYPGCGKILIGEPFKLQLHIDHVHLNLAKSFKCHWAGCEVTLKGDPYRVRFHIDTVHLGIRRYECEWEGCDWTFTLLWNLKQHVLAVHEKLKPFQCDWEGCTYAASNQRQLDRHVKEVHQPTKIKCTWPGCTRDFARTSTLDKHVERDHKDGMPCPVEGCHEKLTTDRELVEHQAKAHGKQFFWCDVQGCDRVFTKPSSREKHKREKHQEDGQILCGAKGCNKLFPTKQEFLRHERDAHGRKVYWCDFGDCDAIYSQKSHLDSHMRREHKDAGSS